MGHRSDCYGRGTALEGDKTTTGAECISLRTSSQSPQLWRSIADHHHQLIDIKDQ